MKKHLFKLFFGLFLMSAACLNAQTFQDTPVLPCQTNRSPLFGKDIVIHDKPDRDQKRAAICSAYNGWLYAAVSFKDSFYTLAGVVSILRSQDNGLTWTFLSDIDYYTGEGDNEFTSVGIMATGNSLENLKIILTFVANGNPEYLIGTGFIVMLNAETGIYEKTIAQITGCYGIAISSDYLYPSLNSNPYSIGILYSMFSYASYKDSLIFLSSNNGGESFNGRQTVASTQHKFHNVALSYGRCASFNSGRYFAAWEEQDNFGPRPGRIFTSHTEPNFNSPFSEPINIDGLDPANSDLCMNPVIACQYNNVDNDSSNLTEIVLFDKFDESTQKYEVKGYYNLQATNHTNYKKLNIPDFLHNGLQPDICFNPFDSTFMMTYFDSTEKKLPFLVNNFRFKNPNQWNIISSGYNDSSNLSVPYPKIALNYIQQKGMNVWSADRTNGKGVAMFDSQYSTWTGVMENNKTDGARLVKAFPNPCSTMLTISFELQKAEEVTVTLYNITGQAAGIIINQYYSSGKHNISYNVSDLPAGSYYYTFKAGDCALSKKITVIK